MIKSLLRLMIILVLGILVYNYFLGDPQEKENARKIFGEMKEVGVAVKDLIKSEKEKFDEGKYDEALDKIGGLFQRMKKEAEDFDNNYGDRIAELDEKRKDLERRLAELAESTKNAPDEYGNDEFTEKGIKEKEKLNLELEKLMAETEKIMAEMERDSDN